MPRSVWTYSQINILMYFKTELDLYGGVDVTKCMDLLTDQHSYLF